MSELKKILMSVGVGFAMILFGLLVHWVSKRLVARLHARKPLTIHDIPVHIDYFYGPFQALIPAIFLAIAVPFLYLPKQVAGFVTHFLTLWIIGSVAWLCVNILHSSRDMVMSRYRMDVTDNLKARRMYTQLRVVERVLIVVIFVIAVASMLMTFDKMRQLGVSVLASAGVMGIVIGFAAQKSLGTLFAGIQIAIAQPIRIDDVVIVDNQWGRIEEINLTYAVVRIWDLRRLIVPITYFMDTPFQNWTRVSADLLGTVYLYVDYTIPVQAIRDELERILNDTPLWDRTVWGLQVTNASEKTMELRALMSAKDSSTAWNLRCLVREKLIEFLQQRFPEALPRVRMEARFDSALKKSERSDNEQSPSGMPARH